MSIFYARLLELAFGPPALGSCVAILVEQPNNSEPAAQASGSFTLPRTCIPPGLEIVSLPAGYSYPNALQEVLARTKPARLILFPPCMHHRSLPDNLREQFPRLNYEEIALQVATESMPAKSLVASLMPSGFFQGQSSRSVRGRIFARCPPKVLITHDHRLQQIGLPVHSAFRMNTVVLEVEAANRGLRFFKCSNAEQLEEEVLADFARLLRQGGGQTRHGYVIREGLPPDAPLLHDLYDPTLVRRQQSIAAIGEVRRVADVADFRQSLHITADASLMRSVESGEGIPVIGGRNIAPEGRILLDDLRHRAEVTDDLHLQEGDICFRVIHGPGERIRLAEVTRDVLPCVAGNHVLGLRFKAGLSVEERQTLVAYFRSAHASEQLNARRGSSLHLTREHLADLPVPILDETLGLALRDINDAISSFRGWIGEAERARDALFEFARPSEDRVQLYELGRLSRRRCDAARLVDDLRHRIRTQFPYPVAFRWRTAEVAQPDLEGVKAVLDCAEAAVCYLACLALLIPRAVDGFAVKYAEQIANRMSDNKPHGTSMGDWIAIVREVRASRAIRRQAEVIPFSEFAGIDDDSDQALQRLSDARNDVAHGRGPEGAEVRPFFERCLADLELFLEGIEFIAEYPFRHVERVRRDSLSKQTSYDYRELMGDHPLMPRQVATTPQGELEESLYVSDRRGTLHLLRPFLNLLECPECGRWSVFYLDRYLKGEGKCVLKSMEHNHTVKDESVVAAFQHAGLLPKS